MVLLWQLSDGDCPLTSHYERSWTFRRNKLNFKQHSHESEETTCHYLVLGRQWVGKMTTCAQSSVSTPNKVRPSWDDQRLLFPKLACDTWKSAIIQRSESQVSLKYFIRAKNWSLLSSIGKQAQAGHEGFKATGLVKSLTNLVSVCVYIFFSVLLGNDVAEKKIGLRKMRNLIKSGASSFQGKFMEFSWNFPIFLLVWKNICPHVCPIQLFRNIVCGKKFLETSDSTYMGVYTWGALRIMHVLCMW